MPKRDLHPELSMEQEFERWLARARQWVQANLTVILLSLAAVAIVVVAVAFHADTKEKTRIAVLTEIDTADMQLRDLSMEKDPDKAKIAEEAALAALSDAAQHAEETPLHAFALLSAANAHYDRGKYDKAVEFYRTVIADYPENYLARSARLGMGAALEQLDRRAEARKVYEETIVDLKGTFPAERARDRLAAIKEILASRPATP